MILAVTLAIAVVVADQLTKEWALRSLDPGVPQPVVGNVLVWVLKFNSGAAFSFMSNATWLFTIVSSAVAILIVWYLRRVYAPIWGVIAGLVLGGAVGNLIDRYLREPGFAVGHVVDFIYTPWMLPAVYNIADIAVVSGMGLFLLCVLLGIDADGRRHRRAPSEGAPPEPTGDPTQ